jgi:hypothetical protein
MTIKHFLVVIAGLFFLAYGLSAQPNNVYDQYGFQIYPPLTKERAIVIVATERSPKKIRLIWYRKDKSILFDKEFNIEQGEKVIISPIIE